jgi:hypothetical protein
MGVVAAARSTCKAARSLRTLLDNLEALRIFEIDEHHHRQVGKMLDRLRAARSSRT